MSDIVIYLNNVGKEYRLGLIGGGTLKEDLQSWWARLRGRDDPNTVIGTRAITNERFWALKDINLEVQQGERLGIIGANGAGKSTLLKLLSRVTAPTTGQISYRGRIASMLEVGTGFHPELTGRENISLNGTILGMTKSEVDRKFDEIVAFSEVEQFIDTPVKRYSSGMYVKLAFAVAAHLDPEILVVDEVLAVGDIKFQQKCLGKMGDVARKGRTVLYVSHNMNTVQQLCNRVVLLDGGRIKFIGDPDEGIKLYIDKSVKLTGSMNLLDKPRVAPVSQGVTMVSAEFVEKNDMTYSSDEAMLLKMRWRANQNLANLSFAVEILYEDDSIAGRAVSTPFFTVINEQQLDITFRLDISNLAPGRYKTIFVVYQPNETGNLLTVDHIDSALSFMVKNTLSYSWHHRWWGHIQLPEIKIDSIRVQ